MDLIDGESESRFAYDRYFDSNQQSNNKPNSDFCDYDLFMHLQGVSKQLLGNESSKKKFLLLT